MDLVGGDPSLFPGLPLRRLWEGPEAGPAWEYPIAEIARVPWAPANAPTRYGSIKTLITPRWHYILHETLGDDLYDRTNDPGDRVNLANRTELLPVVQALRSRLLAAPSSGKVPMAKP